MNFEKMATSQFQKIGTVKKKKKHWKKTPLF